MNEMKMTEKIHLFRHHGKYTFSLQIVYVESHLDNNLGICNISNV